MSKLQQKSSPLKREHPALLDIKFLNLFLFLWVCFALLDPDPGGSGSSILGQGESGFRSRILMTQNWKKFTSEKKFVFFDEKLQFS
jgi:hypothetical protein